jgi:hypothetical protein
MGTSLTLPIDVQQHFSCLVNYQKGIRANNIGILFGWQRHGAFGVCEIKFYLEELVLIFLN